MKRFTRTAVAWGQVIKMSSFIQRTKVGILKKAGRWIRSAINFEDTRPYQSYLYGDKYIEGRIDTVQLFYSLGITQELEGKSWLDLGCHGGSICILASENGATKVTGVDKDVVALSAAREHADAAKANISFIQQDIIGHVDKTERYDVVSLFALFRHIHASLLNAKGLPVPQSTLPYLVNSSYETLILGENNPVDIEFRAFIKKCLDASDRYFFCSFNDRPGILVRRKEQVETFFRSISKRIDTIESFQMAAPNQDYTVVAIRMLQN